MRAWGVLVLLLAACVAAEPTPAAEAPAATPAPLAEPAPMPPPAMALNCAGAFTQGGVVICRTVPGAQMFVDGVESGRADAQGWAVIGFNREHPAQGQVEARVGRETLSQSYAIAPRQFDIQRVDGLPQNTVTPSDPAVLARIQRESALKQVGFASMSNLEGFLDGFIWPVDGRISGTWGNQRILNGTPSTPHFGVDIAAPTGTPIRAPAAGVVSFANPDMHYEGGLVFIDHGQGLITMYLHMSRLDVVEGQRVAQGDVIGAVGASGRATGPHLCWRMRWRERQLDPSVAIDGLQAARTQLAAR
jgi:murein DD-endopeptidase MepM/ murein hydrolase activator NlpD